MIKFLRKKSTQKKIFLFLAVIIIPAFVFWGVTLSKNDAGQLPSTLGFIGNRKVSLQDYADSYRAVQHEIVLRYGEKAAQIAPFINVRGEAWDRLLLLDHARKEHIRVSDEEVVQWLTNQPAFRKNDAFDKEFYDLFVTQYLRMSAKDFEDEIRDLLVLDKLREKLRDSVYISDTELRDRYDRLYRQRDLAYAVLSWESEKENVEVSEEDVDKVYPILKEQFVTKEGEPFDEDTIRAEIRKLLVRQKAGQLAAGKLEEMTDRVRSSSFESVLADENLDIQKLEKFSKESEIPFEGLSASDLDALLELKKGEVGSYRTAEGAVIVRVDKEWPADTAGFENEKEAFKQEMRDEKTVENMGRLLEDLRKDLKVDLETMRLLFASEPAAAS